MGRNVKCAEAVKMAWRILKKLKTGLRYDPAIPLLGMSPKEVKAVT